MKKILTKIIEFIMVGNVVFMQMNGWIDYPGIGRIYDSEVYRLIVNHSRLIDRLIPARMVEMSLFGQNILMGLYPNIDPFDLSWKFYGKHSKNMDWGD